MEPINRLLKFEDLCDQIAKELAIYYDGIENTSDEFKSESLIIANCVRKRVEGVLTFTSPSTVRRGLELMFDLQPQVNSTHHDSQPKIRTSLQSRVSRDGRTLRRRSSASNIVYVGVQRSSGVEVYSRQNQFIRRT